MTQAEFPEQLDGVVGRDPEGRLTVTFTRFYPHSVEHVWQAITDPEQNCNWIGRLQFEPRAGGKMSIVLNGAQPDDDLATAGEVMEYSPPHVLEYWMQARHMDQVRTDHHINRWELEQSDGGCTLRFINTFAPGERARNSILCGWHEMLEKVDSTVAGKTTDWENYTRDRIVELYWHYRNKPLPQV